ncbi:hypothetical protein IFM89_028446, partial [Coptis chinensis]
MKSFSTKVFRNLQTGESEGYGVINFCTHANAEKVFQTYNGITMPQTEQPFQLNWASSSVCDKRSDLDSEYSLFVGNLAPDVTSTLLGELFLRKYPSVTEANVVFDENTGRSKSIGFVTFSDDNERVFGSVRVLSVRVHRVLSVSSSSGGGEAFNLQQHGKRFEEALEEVQCPTSLDARQTWWCICSQTLIWSPQNRKCLPLILILRNTLKYAVYALTYREVVAILMQRHILVDGKVRT